MLEYKKGYIDAYEAEMRALLDVSGELSLFHSPGVYISGNKSIDNANCIVDGEQIDENDKNKHVGIDIARIGVEYIRNLVKKQLIIDEVEGFPEGADPLDYKAEIKLITTKMIDLVDTADYSYSVYNFYDHDSQEEVSVVVSMIIDNDTKLSARELRIATADEYVKKEVAIHEITTPSNKTSYDISQTLQPVSDPALYNAVKFFYDCGEPDDAETILTIYYEELIGSTDATPQETYLMNKYQSNEKYSELQQVLKDIKNLGHEARQSGIFQRTNPEIALPSSDELMKYKSLLDRARS